MQKSEGPQHAFAQNAKSFIFKGFGRFEQERVAAISSPPTAQITQNVIKTILFAPRRRAWRLPRGKSDGRKCPNPFKYKAFGALGERVLEPFIFCKRPERPKRYKNHAFCTSTSGRAAAKGASAWPPMASRGFPGPSPLAAVSPTPSRRRLGSPPWRPPGPMWRCKKYGFYNVWGVLGACRN